MIRPRESGVALRFPPQSMSLLRLATLSDWILRLQIYLKRSD
jgi:hypothetical protein